MGKFKIEYPNGKFKWVKNIDKVNEELEFTNNPNEAYDRDGGYYTTSEIDFVKFHFKDKYPEVKYLIADWDC